MNTTQAKELGQKLIKVSSAIEGYEYNKSQFENNTFEIGVWKNNAPYMVLEAILTKEEVNDIVKSAIVKQINENIKSAQKELDSLIPSTGAN